MNKQYKKNIYIAMILIWMVTIYIFSSQVSEESSQKSNLIINVIIEKKPFINIKTEEQKDELRENLVYPIRKLAHFSIYTVGGILIYLFSKTFKIREKNRIISSFLLGSFYACTDEFHQLFVQGRSGEIMDVLIDSLGVLSGIFLIYWIYRLREYNKNKEDIKEEKNEK